MTFEEWKRNVNRYVSLRIGFDCDDLPDENYWDEWNEGTSPSEMAEIVVTNNGYGN